jgi:hypothetical protein
MRAGAAVSQRISGSFQIPGKCTGSARAGPGIATDGYASAGIPGKVKAWYRDLLAAHILCS